MKHIYALGVVFFFVSLQFLSAQKGNIVDLVYTDNGGVEHTYALHTHRIVGGKNGYVSDPIVAGVTWDNGRQQWVIRGHNSQIYFYSNYKSRSNPPDLSSGNWQPEIPGYILGVLAGSGTYKLLQTDTFTKRDIGCAGQTDGRVAVAIGNGRPPYKFTWSDGTITKNVSQDTLKNLAPGDYSVTITDSDIGKVILSATIVDAQALAITSAQATDVACNGQSNGKATIVVEGGSEPYAYQWSNGATTANLTDVPAGNYRVTVTDGCQSTATAAIMVKHPSSLDAGLYVQNNPSCNGKDDGIISSTATGGPQGTSYRYLWSNGSTESFLMGVPADTYSVTITDDNNCTVSGSLVLTPLGGPTATLAVDADVTCQGGTDGAATLTVENAAEPVTYAWSTGATTPAVTELAAGEYTVTATDSDDCFITSKVTISEPPALTLEVDATQDNGYSDGTAKATAMGGTGSYTYTWTTDPAQTTAEVTDLMGGQYTVTVTDENSCSYSDSVLVRALGDSCANAMLIDTLFNGELDMMQYSRSYGNAAYQMDTLSNDELTAYFGNDTLFHPVYYRFTGDGNIYHIRTADCNGDNALTDTRAALFAGACSLDSMIRRSDNYSETDSMPLIEIQTEEGVEYTLLVDAGDTTRGTFCLSVTQMATVPVRRVAPSVLRVYPNPTGGRVRYDNIEARRVTVSDSYGRRVLQLQATANEVDLGSLPTGVYTLQVTDVNNKLYISRVVKR
ncbi:T9SS type A sorting domain-containing protein [Lewinella sp. IMCC34191]|uniref:T9SS type A sorting domain-containing protein n=1 Tax=Lewinella sp. IMCC34191 TaxID=2259172 RepID=UPI000E25028A|nr:T9SS type A sorting domain-containing protein [Lewinella sp. IMCC34191]